MKHKIYILLLAIAIGFTQCCKEKPGNNNNNDIPGLPPATQTGANTLGFLLNGVPWTPAGNNGTANLSVDFDGGVANGVFGISAYRILSGNNREYFGIGIKDSLNFYTAPFTISLTNISLYRFYFSNNNCAFFSTDLDTQGNGTLFVSKLDRINRIISGTFSATLIKAGCTDIKITDGRFDMKY